jgi:hypothetical protein
MTYYPNAKGFRPADTLSYIAVGLLAAVLLCAVLSVIFSFVTLAAPDYEIVLHDGETLNVGFMLLGLTALLRIPVFIAAVVFFLIWEHRSFTSLAALKANSREFSPGWAVGWWFIPFANLVKPFQAMRELYNQSEPEVDSDSDFLLPVAAGTPTLIGFWWAFWILANVANNIASRFDDLKALPVLVVAASMFELLAGGLLIKIILDINKRQQQRFQNLGAVQLSDVPPPPREFGGFQGRI